MGKWEQITLRKHTSKYRWVVFAAVLFTYFLIVSQRTAPGLITDHLMHEFKISASTIGLLASIQFLAYAGFQVPIGIWSDRLGANRFLVIGTLLCGIGTIIYSLAQGEYVLLFARLLVGLGDAAIWINVVLILNQWFRANEFVKLLGFAGMSGSFGFLLATVPFSAWISIFGWRPPFLTAGLIIFLCGILLYFVLVKIPRRVFGETETVVTVDKTKDEPRENSLLILRRVFTDRQAWATFFCHFGLVGTYIGFIGSWAVPFGMQDYGMTRSGASQLIMIGLIGALVGAPLTTWLTGRIGSIKRPYVIVHGTVFVCWLMFFLFGGHPPFALLIILFLIIGYGNGASALTFAVVRQSFDVKKIGVVSGFANTGGFLSAVLLPIIFGQVLDHFHGRAGYHYGFIISVIFSLLGLLGGLLIKEKRRDVAKG